MRIFFQSSIFTWGLNLLFFALIYFVFVIAIRSLRSGNRQNYVEYAPSLMTSLGLFGTFLGIFIGLVQFDAKHIDGSIEQLLNGLQTAFVTSIFGMAFAIAFKVKQTAYMDTAKPGDTVATRQDIEPKDIYNVLIKQHTELKIIAKGIGGNDERSMVGQLQLLRTEFADLRGSLNKRQEAFEVTLWVKLDTFAAMLSKSATEQVIVALKQVIVAFNEKLTEQFGDNFKHLDQSVKKLVDWQASYMQQLGEMTQLYRLGVESIGATQLAVASIRVETSRIPSHMEMLGDVINVNQHQINELERHLDAFVTMRDQAVIAVPQLQEKLEQVGEQLRSGAEQVNMVLLQGAQQFEESVKHANISLVASASVIADQSEKISDDLKDALEGLTLNTERIRSGITTTISETMNAVAIGAQAMVDKNSEASNVMLATIQHSLNAAIEGSNQSRSEMQRVMDSANTAMVQHADRSLQGVEKQVQEAVNRTNEAVNAQLRQLDEALSRQLNAALQELGASLGTIARHVADTYQRASERHHVDS